MQPRAGACAVAQVSNYAQPGRRSRHNQVYWRGEPYYAFGLGAASYLAGRRFSRPAKMKDYYAWVQGFCEAGGHTQRAGLGWEGLSAVGLSPLPAVLGAAWLRHASGLSAAACAAAAPQEAGRPPWSCQRRARRSSCWTW
jgi:hypothetical protein